MASSDSFNRADNALSMGNADTGETWFMVTPATNFGIIGNEAYAPDTNQGGGTIGATTVIDSGLSDCAVEVTVVDAGDFGGAKASGLAWRLDGSNFSGYLISGTTVAKGSGVGYGVLGAPLSPGVSDGAVVRVEANGDTHRIYINDALVRTFTDAAWQTETHHGLHTADTTSPKTNRFDDFSVSPLFTNALVLGLRTPTA